MLPGQMPFHFSFHLLSPSGVLCFLLILSFWFNIVTALYRLVLCVLALWFLNISFPSLFLTNHVSLFMMLFFCVAVLRFSPLHVVFPYMFCSALSLMFILFIPFSICVFPLYFVCLQFFPFVFIPMRLVSFFFFLFCFLFFSFCVSFFFPFWFPFFLYFLSGRKNAFAFFLEFCFYCFWIIFGIIFQLNDFHDFQAKPSIYITNLGLIRLSGLGFRVYIYIYTYVFV